MPGIKTATALRRLIPGRRKHQEPVTNCERYPINNHNLFGLDTPSVSISTCATKDSLAPPAAVHSTRISNRGSSILTTWGTPDRTKLLQGLGQKDFQESAYSCPVSERKRLRHRCGRFVSGLRLTSYIETALLRTVGLVPDYHRYGPSRMPPDHRPAPQRNCRYARRPAVQAA